MLMSKESCGGVYLLLSVLYNSFFLLFKLPISIEIFLQLSAVEHIVAQQADYLE